jgi:hypothetical protein
VRSCSEYDAVDPCLASAAVVFAFNEVEAWHAAWVSCRCQGNVHTFNRDRVRESLRGSLRVEPSDSCGGLGSSRCRLAAFSSHSVASSAITLSLLLIPFRIVCSFWDGYGAEVVGPCAAWWISGKMWRRACEWSN